VPHPANNNGMLMSPFSPCFVTRLLKYPVFRPPRALQDKKLAYFIPMPFTGCGTRHLLLRDKTEGITRLVHKPPSFPSAPQGLRSWRNPDFYTNLLILILFFLTKKVCKKVKAVEKSYDFAFDLRRRQKNSPASVSGAIAPKNGSGSNSFWLYPAPVEQNRDFSKAGIRRAEWTGDVEIPSTYYFARMYNSIGTPVNS
jgi:hypothetical protein